MSDPTVPEPRAVGDRDAQRNLAERLFPGPSRQRSRQYVEHVDNLLKPLDRKQLSETIRQRREAEAAARGAGKPTAASAPPAATADDVAALHDLLEKQNELLQAILSSTVDSQTDARSTAQNSRTFAWAGTAIALITLAATVVLVVQAATGR